MLEKIGGMTVAEILIGGVVSILLLIAIGIRVRDIIQRAKATVSTPAPAPGSMKDGAGLKRCLRKLL